MSTIIDLVEYFFNNKKSFFNMNYGILIYNEKFWLGSSIYNLLQPDISLSSSKNSLNRNYSIHGGINIDERINGNINVNVMIGADGEILKQF